MLEIAFHITLPEVKAASLDSVRSWSAGEGLHGLVFWQIIATKAAAVDRLDLVRHFIEERNVTVNTIGPEEKKIMKPFQQSQSDVEFSDTLLALAIVCH